MPGAFQAHCTRTIARRRPLRKCPRTVSEGQRVNLLTRGQNLFPSVSIIITKFYAHLHRKTSVAAPEVDWSASIEEDIHVRVGSLIHQGELLLNFQRRTHEADKVHGASIDARPIVFGMRFRTG